MRKSKPSQGTRWPKLQKRSGGPPVIGNKHLAEQTRKILGKHYANKYRAR